MVDDVKWLSVGQVWEHRETLQRLVIVSVVPVEYRVQGSSRSRYQCLLPERVLEHYWQVAESSTAAGGASAELSR